MKNSYTSTVYRVTLLGSVCNVALSAFKLVVGIVGHSSALIADAVHSLSDLLSDVVVMLSVKLSSKPEDNDHDYGHGKFETLGTAIVSIILIAIGIGIMWDGANSIWGIICGKQLAAPSVVAFIAALVSVFVKELLFHYTMIKGKKIKSQSLVANAWHHRSDSVSSLGTAVGIGGAVLLGPSWRLLDPLAAIVVSILIMRMGVKMLIPTTKELTDESLPLTDENFIFATILRHAGVSDPHHLRTRRIGNYCSIDFHLRMDGELPLWKAHNTTRTIETELKKHFGKDTIINIHMEPAKGTKGYITPNGDCVEA